MKVKHGFTLIELLVVVAIIGILSAAILVLMNSVRYDAQEARMHSDMSAFHLEVMANYGGIGNYGTPTELQDPCDFGIFSATRTQIIAIVVEGYIDNPIECAVGAGSQTFAASALYTPTGNSICVSNLGVFINDLAADGGTEDAICE